MNWIEDTLADFGRLMGIDQLQADAQGRLQLELGGGDLLSVESHEREGEEEVLVHLSVPVGYQAAVWVQRALARCHEEAAARWPLQMGVRGTGSEARGLLLVRTPARGFTPQSLGQMVDTLRRSAEGIRLQA